MFLLPSDKAQAPPHVLIRVFNMIPRPPLQIPFSSPSWPSLSPQFLPKHKLFGGYVSLLWPLCHSYFLGQERRLACSHCLIPWWATQFCGKLPWWLVTSWLVPFARSEARAPLLRHEYIPTLPSLVICSSFQTTAFRGGRGMNHTCPHRSNFMDNDLHINKRSVPS